MKIKNVKLEWYALRYDFNSHSVKKYNVLNDELKDIIVKHIKKKEITNLVELKDRVDRWLHYYYWCKTECEMLMGGLFDELEQFTKFDIYAQLEPNLDKIVSYINNEMELELK